MAPYIAEALVQERTQRFMEDAARYRRLADGRARRRVEVRLAVGRALVAAGRRLAGRNWSRRPPAGVTGQC